jgi:hypothetical protein
LNFTNFGETNTVSIGDDFCDDCHSDEKTELLNFGFRHKTQDCSSCHGTHNKSDADCLSCHSEEGSAQVPTHSVENQYTDCLECHESGHVPKNIVFNLPDVEREFCAEVTCHGGPDGIATIFEMYGAGHEQISNDCIYCHSSHEVGRNCIEAGCHSSTTPNHSPDYEYEDCLECHRTAHSPTLLASMPGGNLSQRDYMSSYHEIDVDSTSNSFIWIKRGNHVEYDNCSECHIDSETSLYPASAVPLMNASGTDCAGTCHSWIDTSTTGDPFTLLNEPSNTFTKHFESFNGSTGGCSGTCHQSNPNSPVYDGTGHGEITTCLNDNCHGGGDFYPFGGWLHEEHGDMLSASNLECGDRCHDGSGKSFVLINGGCYDCHKSGHVPRILDTSPCYRVGELSCHINNVEP